MLRQRVLTAAALLSLLLAAVFLLSNVRWAVVAIAALAVAGREWARLAGYATPGQVLYAALLTLAAGAIVLAEHGLRSGQAFIYSVPGKALYTLCVIFWLAIVPAWLHYRWEVRSRVLLALVGLIVLLPFWHALAWLQATPARLLGAMAVVWISDTAAYFFGRAFGRHKLAAAISPGKTWEGVAGAILAVAVAWVGLVLAAPGFADRAISGLAVAVLLAVLGIQGDLFESWIKRLAGRKDSGALLPGHGGLLDRVDALTSTLPLAALYFAYPLLRA